ncbi:LysR substrate-binding domain-containing protein [Variovorax sp. PCZ-1]|uniref:LysR substrate-binding domain-containing protein n=1 Tax=Variovorax sp. PCZ-1 TaxID=2835533 RepID=UPI001BCD07CB|nr:LysR substrate-binding domain-containing protein [Variovorax sp. PCZ-1]MBS7809259.1 LysR family transcriptional regulator [Variovorax sp. PCZ-1]
MRFTEIETFRALMRTGTTHKAAQLLRVTQPAVSQSLKRLETQAGLTLFQRRSGRLVPTPEAQALIGEIDRVFIGMDAIEHRLSSLRDFGLGRMEISCYPAFGLGFLPRALASLRAQLDLQPPTRWPQVSLQVLSSKDVLDRVSRGACDFGLMADELPLEGINHSTFAKMSGVVVMPSGHALARFKKITPSQLAEVDFIALNPEDASRHRLETALASHGVSLRVAAHTPYAASVCEMALRGLGVGLVNPITALDYAERGLVVRRLSVDVQFACILVLPGDKVLSRTAQSFLAVMRHQLAEDERRLKTLLK